MVFPNCIQKDMRKTEMLHVFLSSYLLGESRRPLPAVRSNQSFLICSTIYSLICGGSRNGRAR